MGYLQEFDDCAAPYPTHHRLLPYPTPIFVSTIDMKAAPRRSTDPPSNRKVGPVAYSGRKRTWSCISSGAAASAIRARSSIQRPMETRRGCA